MYNKKIHREVQSVLFSLLSEIDNENYVVEEEIKSRLLNAKYIIYNKIEEIDKKYLKRLNKLDLILANGMTQILVEKNVSKNKYEMRAICFIKENCDKDTMNMTILHELIHILSTQTTVEKYINKLTVKQGFEEIVFTTDKEGICIGSYINKDYEFLNEAYTQFYARKLYEKIYKKEFPKNKDAYYARTKIISIFEIIDANPNNFKDFINSNIANEKKIFYDGIIDLIKTIEDGYNVRLIRKETVYKSVIDNLEKILVKEIDRRKNRSPENKAKIKALVSNLLSKYK